MPTISPYVIFLPKRYFRTTKFHYRLFQRIKGNIVKSFSDKGIIAKKMSDLNSMPNCTFDNHKEPKNNILYIHLINGEYFSDRLYARVKIEKERDLLFLLAAKLGVSTIEYDTELIETSLSQIEASTNVKQVNFGSALAKKTTKTKGQSGKETYLNRGAPVYCLSKNIDQIEENIKYKFEKLNNKLFSYDFYKSSHKLVCFVYKRFSFKMLSLEYTTESEDVLEKSFEANATLLEYGLGLHFQENISITEKIIYKMTFFTDHELRLKLSEVIRIENDPFAVIREVYNSEEDKDLAIYNITEYVRKYAKFSKVNYKRGDLLVTDNYHGRLLKWIHANDQDTFKNVCKTFTSTYQIKTWLKSTLKEDNDVDSIDTETDNNDLMNLGIKNFEKFKNRILQYEESVDDHMFNKQQHNISSTDTEETNRHSIWAEEKNNIDSDISHPSWEENY